MMLFITGASVAAVAARACARRAVTPVDTAHRAGRAVGRLQGSSATS